MGCGAIKSRSKETVKECPLDDTVPANIVLCSATRPDWAQVDYLVFEIQDLGDHIDPSNRHTQGAFEDDDSESEDGGPKKAAPPIKPGAEKGGRFFSKRQSCVGDWRINGNVLTMVWPFTTKTDTALALTSPRLWVNRQNRMEISVIDPEENPDWFMPDVIGDKFQAETVSNKTFECPVCYFELYKFPCGVIRLHSRRCCGHYFHKDCAQYLLKAMKGSGRPASCPLCGVTFSEVKAMPDLLTDPRDWFAVCDVDFGGELDTHEVVEALGCVLPVNRHKLEKHVRAHWHEWDPDGDGTITLHEFIMPVKGLKDWIIHHISMLRADGAPRAASVPSIDRNPREWFHYWDRDASGTLEKDEVCRALIRTFCRDDNGHPILIAAHDMREIAVNLWRALGYSPFDAVSFEEFVAPYGLLDQFLQNQTQTAWFGQDTAE